MSDEKPDACPNPECGGDWDLDEILNVPFVFWVCPKGCRGGVEWNDEKNLATCLQCGSKSHQPPSGCGTDSPARPGEET